MPRVPKVSIVLSSYNHAEYIGESIQSILDQTFDDFELFIIDDHSTDDSWRIIKQYKDPRITAIRNKKNIGVVIRPEIINQLKGKYLAMAHCDDRWNPTKLEKQVKFLDTHSEYVACFTRVKLIDDGGNEFVDGSHYYYGIFQENNCSRLEWLQQFFYRGNALCHPSVLLRMDAQKEYDLYAVGLAALPDEYRWAKLCLHQNIYVYPEKLTEFRVRGNDENTSGDKLENKLRYQFESFVLPSLFTDVLNYSKSDFLVVFPSAEKFFVDGENDMEYIFARLLIELPNQSYQLYGMNLLWKIMQDRARKLNLESKYKFTNKDFVEMSGSIDVFGFLTNENVMISTLYYDTGKGFNDNEKISQRVYINSRGVFYASFDVSHIRHISNLRFDPFEKLFMKFKNVKIIIDGEEAPYELSAHRVLNDGYIESIDGDPQFLMSNCMGKKIIVTGLIKLISYDEVSEKIRGMQEQLDQTSWQYIRQRLQKRYNRISGKLRS